MTKFWPVGGVLFVIFTLALGLGCVKETPPSISDKEQINALVKAYHDAVKNMDADSLSKMLTAELWARESGEILQAFVVVKALGIKLPTADPAIEDVTISVDTAEAKVGEELWKFKREERVWKISTRLKKPGTPLTTHKLGEAVIIRDSNLKQLFGEPKPKGDVKVMFDTVEKANSVDDHFTGRGIQKPKGVFLVIYYTVTNNLTSDLQPATQINDELIIKDGRDRQWNKIDYRGEYIARSGDFAISKGKAQPETKVGAGFSTSTAIAFDVPVDAVASYLYSENLGIKVLLEQVSMP